MAEIAVIVAVVAVSLFWVSFIVSRVRDSRQREKTVRRLYGFTDKEK
jgi:hypothetical protein